MKSVKKKTIDELIEMERNFFGVSLDEREKLRDARNQMLNKIYMETGIFRVQWDSLMLSIFGKGGFNPNSTNLELYMILKILGMEVVDE